MPSHPDLQGVALGTCFNTAPVHLGLSFCSDPSLYPRAEKTMTFTHHRPWKSLKIDPRKDVGLAGFCGRAVYPGKSGGRDFRKRKG